MTSKNILTKYNSWLTNIDFLATVPTRLILAVAFWTAGLNKLAHIQDVSGWFESLGLPWPLLMAYLAAITEFIGSILLFLGLGTRLICIPLIITMLVAIGLVHWDFGWSAIAQSNFIPTIGSQGITIASNPEITERLDRIRDILQTNGNYEWLTAKGSLVILQNGIEFAAIYLVMLTYLFIHGPGRYFSVDYWIDRRYNRHTIDTN